MSKYVGGYILPMPKRSLRAYRRVAMKKMAGEWRAGISRMRSGRLWAQFGAPFPKQLKLKSYNAMFSWIAFKARAQLHRISVMVMKDPRIAAMTKEAAPGDCERMPHGGFVAIVDA